MPSCSRFADVRFAAHYGAKSDIDPCPKTISRYSVGSREAADARAKVRARAFTPPFQFLDRAVVRVGA